MDAWFKVLLMLSAGIACASQAQRPQTVRHPTTIAQVISVYNKGSQENVFYRSLEAESVHRLEVPASPLRLRFTMKETTCAKSEQQNAQECDFKEGGLVKACSASLVTEQDTPALVVSCDSVTKQHSHTKQSGRNARPGTERRKCRVGQGNCPAKPTPRPGFLSILSVQDHQEEHMNSHVKRSLNTEPQRKRDTPSTTKRRCKGGQGKCPEEKPDPLAGRFSSISSLSLEKTELLGALPKNSRAKRSLNTEPQSKGDTPRTTKRRCKGGQGKCPEEKPDPVAGRFSSIASLPSKKTDLLGTLLKNSRAKRSLNTEPQSKRDTPRNTKRRCKGGQGKCPEEKPDPVPGRFSSIASLPSKKTELLGTLLKNSLVKRSLNTEPQSKRDTQRTKKKKCKGGQGKCLEEKPDPLPGGFSSIASIELEKTELLGTLIKNSLVKRSLNTEPQSKRDTERTKKKKCKGGQGKCPEEKPDPLPGGFSSIASIELEAKRSHAKRSLDTELESLETGTTRRRCKGGPGKCPKVKPSPMPGSHSAIGRNEVTKKEIS